VMLHLPTQRRREGGLEGIPPPPGNFLKKKKITYIFPPSLRYKFFLGIPPGQFLEEEKNYLHIPSKSKIQIFFGHPPGQFLEEEKNYLHIPSKSKIQIFFFPYYCTRKFPDALVANPQSRIKDKRFKQH
jgi:hypothetical protein